MEDEHSRTRKVPQVIMFVNEMYNKLDVSAFNVKTIHQLGDELDGEHLLNGSQSWKKVKESTQLDKKRLVQFLKDSSEKNIYCKDYLHEVDTCQGQIGYLFLMKY